MTFDRSGGDDVILNTAQISPLQNNLFYYNSSVTTLFSGSLAAVLGPTVTVSTQRTPVLPSTYNWSLGIQRNLGFGVFLDLACVGTGGRHQRRTIDVNTAPYGTKRQLSSCDPTTALPASPLPLAAPCTLMQDNFLRPLRGYQAVVYQSFDGSTNYHSMQLQLNRRVRGGLQIGGNWTWSKAMNYDNFPYVPRRRPP